MGTVIRNLTSNAIKFTHNNGSVVWTAALVGSDIQISISDTGTGLTPEKCQTILTSRSERSTNGTQGEKGTGLGLLLCNEFVNLNGGTLSVESEIGQGTTFHIRLKRPSPN